METIVFAHVLTDLGQRAGNCNVLKNNFVRFAASYTAGAGVQACPRGNAVMDALIIGGVGRDFRRFRKGFRYIPEW